MVKVFTRSLEDANCFTAEMQFMPSGLFGDVFTDRIVAAVEVAEMAGGDAEESGDTQDEFRGSGRAIWTPASENAKGAPERDRLFGNPIRTTYEVNVGGHRVSVIERQVLNLDEISACYRRR